MRKVWGIALAVLLAGAMATLATGAVRPAKHSASGVVKACASKRTGVIRLANRCRKSEKKLQWNVRGRRGPAGAARGTKGRQGPRGRKGARGATGAQGPQGAKGDAGTANAVTTQGAPGKLVDGPANTVVTSTATCDPGTHLLGGGFDVSGDVTKAIVTTSMPSKTLANTWTATVMAHSSNADVGITAYAICA
jgi:hypothetical protein